MEAQLLDQTPPTSLRMLSAVVVPTDNVIPFLRRRVRRLAISFLEDLLAEVVEPALSCETYKEAEQTFVKDLNVTRTSLWGLTSLLLQEAQKIPHLQQELRNPTKASIPEEKAAELLGPERWEAVSLALSRVWQSAPGLLALFQGEEGALRYLVVAHHLVPLATKTELVSLALFHALRRATEPPPWLDALASDLELTAHTYAKVADQLIREWSGRSPSPPCTTGDVSKILESFEVAEEAQVRHFLQDSPGLNESLEQTLPLLSKHFSVKKPRLKLGKDGDQVILLLDAFSHGAPEQIAETLASFDQDWLHLPSDIREKIVVRARALR